MSARRHYSHPPAAPFLALSMFTFGPAVLLRFLLDDTYTAWP
jgi:hypothetical protein